MASESFVQDTEVSQGLRRAREASGSGEDEGFAGERNALFPPSKKVCMYTYICIYVWVYVCS